MKTIRPILLLWLFAIGPTVMAATAVSPYTETLRYFQANPMKQAIQLTWPSAEKTATGYRIYRQLSQQARQGEEVVLLTQLDPDISSYTDRDIQDDQVYVYYLSVMDEKGEETSRSLPITGRSLDVIPPRPPGKPSIMVEETKAGPVFILSWEKSPDKDVTVYRIYRGLDTIQPLIPVAQIRADKGEMHFADHLQALPRYVYEYAVSAVDSAGNESPIAGPLPAPMADHRPPAAPVLSSIKATTKGVLLSWRPPADNDLAAYNIYRKAGDEKQWTLLAQLSSKHQGYLDKQAYSGQYYQYGIAAVDKHRNEGPRSDSRSQSSLQVMASPSPKNFRIHNKGKQLLLSWQPVKAAGLQGYLLYRDRGDKQGFLKISSLLQSSRFIDRIKPGDGLVKYRLLALYKRGETSQPVEAQVIVHHKKQGGNKK